MPFIARNAIEFIVGLGFALCAWCIMLWRLKVRLQGFTGDALCAVRCAAGL